MDANFVQSVYSGQCSFTERDADLAKAVKISLLFHLCISNYYHPLRSWGKVIFSEACVKNSVHDGGWGWYPSMPCMSPGPHPGGRLSGLAGRVSRPTPRGRLRGLAGGGMGLQAHTWGVSRPTPRGEVEGSGWEVSRPTSGGSPGPHLGECIPACTEADTPPPQQTATAAGSMHPTGPKIILVWFIFAAKMKSKRQTDATLCNKFLWKR